MGNVFSSCLAGSPRLRQRSPLSPEERYAASLERLPDDCLGEVFKWCPDNESKRNLRAACRMTFHSPAINSQVAAYVLNTFREDTMPLSWPPPGPKVLHLHDPVPVAFFKFASAEPEVRQRLSELISLGLVSLIHSCVHLSQLLLALKRLLLAINGLARKYARALCRVSCTVLPRPSQAHHEVRDAC
jgi:hypothetical protein